MKLSPELVSFLLVLRRVKQQNPAYSCFGQFLQICAGHDPWCDAICVICKKVCTIDGIDWIDTILKAYPGGE